MRTTLSRSIAVIFVVAIAACGAAPAAPREASTEKADPDYDSLCAGVAPDQQARCPMGAWTQSIDDVEGGVLLHLNATAPAPDETQKRMRCHRAWMAHDPGNAMPRCPIGSPGIAITARAGASGTDLSLLASKPEDVQEIRKRAHAAIGK